MVPLRYLSPFAFLALLPVGGWLGGAWTFIGAAATPLCLVSLDRMLGEDRALPQLASGPASRWAPRIYILLQLVANAWAAVWIARPSVGLLEMTGLAVSAGVTTGVFGFVAAHEMIHSPVRLERALGLALLGSVFDLHFRIAHVYGHHRRAATLEDPASARLGEGLYAFLMRSISGQFREAWTFEAQRRRRTGRPLIGPGNRMVAYVTTQALFFVAIALASGRALAFSIAVAVIAVSLLESFNYVAHYGLSRRTGPDGRPERLHSQHSWNSARRMNNAALFNMGRHSDHHRRMTKPYERLKALPGATHLPSGYAAALLTALVPPLWRRVMDHRAEAAMAAQPRKAA
jgi:alkane 1-monooxygenase